MDKNTNNNLLLVATGIIALMMFVCFWQNKVLDNYKQLLEKTDTTTIIETDTIYRDKIVVDSVPKYINQLILKTDTVFQKEGDSISAQPMVIALKKKKLVE